MAGCNRSEIEDIWRRAVSRYYETTERSRVGDKPLIEHLTDISQLEAYLDDERTKFETFRSKHSRITGPLKKCIAPFTQLSKITASVLPAAATEATFAPVSMILGAAMFLVQAAEGVTQAYDWIEELLGNFSNFAERLELYIKGEVPPLIQAKAVEILACLLEVLAYTEKTIRTRRFRKFTARLFFGQDEYVKSLFDKLATLFDSEQRIVDSISLVTTLKILETVNSTDGKTQHLIEEERKRELKKILDWTSLVDFPQRQSSNLKNRYANTGLWFINNPKFQAWAANPDQTLFCLGPPGAGKTTMAALVIDHLQKTMQSDRSGVVYLYCDYTGKLTRKDGGTVEQSLENFLAAMLRQLCQRRVIPDELKSLYDSKSFDDTTANISEIISVISVVCKLYTKVYLIIDAADECDPAVFRHLLRQICWFMKPTTSVHLLVTSRSIPDVQSTFEETIKDFESLEIKATDEDLILWFDGNLEDLPGFFRGDVELQNFARNKIIELAGGMFLLARLHFERFKGMTVAGEVRQALSNTSNISSDSRERSYSQAYDSAIDRIQNKPPSQARLALKTLLLISHASRHLKVLEIRHALAVQEGSNEINPSDLPPLKTIQTVCVGLVSHDENDTIRLLHFTTEEYIKHNAIRLFTKPTVTIASICIQYVSLGPFKMSAVCEDAEKMEERFKIYPFYEYAGTYWARHLLPVEADLFKTSRSTLLSGNVLRNAHQAQTQHWEEVPLEKQRELGYETYWKWDEDATPLDIIAKSGLAKIYAKLFRPKDWDNPRAVLKGRFGLERIPWPDAHLIDAAEHDSNEMMELLLRGNGNRCFPPRILWTALGVASRRGYTNVVRTILRHVGSEGDGSNACAMATIYNHSAVDKSDACAVAAIYGHSEVFDILLKCGPNTNHILWRMLSEKSEFSDTYDAGGSLNAMECLLDEGADPEWRPSVDKMSSLEFASRWGRPNAMTIFLNRGADVNASSEKHGTALAIAAEEGHQDVLQVLLKRGADVNASTSNRPALVRAVYKQREDIIRILLECDANANASSASWTVLMAASRVGNKNIVDDLLKHGANVNASSEEHGTALMIASEKGNRDVVNVLVKHGANVNAYSEKHGTALMVASEQGHEAIVIDLLRHGADTNVSCGKKDTALMKAAKRGRVDVAVRLLKHGVDPNAICGKEGSALSGAILGFEANVDRRSDSEDHREIVRLLFDYGAEISDAFGEKYGSPLITAVLLGQEKILEALLKVEDRFDPNAIGKREYGTALIAASQRGYLNAVQLLIDRGADVNLIVDAAHSPFPTALEAALDFGRSIIGSERTFKTAETLAIVEILLSRGANIPPSKGPDMLHYALCYGCDKNVVAAFLDRGVNPNAKSPDSCGAQSQSLLFSARDPDVFKLLVQRGGKVNRGIYNALLEHELKLFTSLKLAKFFKEQGADVRGSVAQLYEQANVYLEPDLVTFATSTEYIEWLFSFEGVPQIMGRHVLSEAVKHKLVKWLEILVSRGVDINPVPVGGWRWSCENILLALIKDGKSDERIFRYVVEHGADVEKYGHEAMRLAVAIYPPEMAVFARKFKSQEVFRLKERSDMFLRILKPEEHRMAPENEKHDDSGADAGYGIVEMVRRKRGIQFWPPNLVNKIGW